ncbi:MAG TPA: FHA domain-containing protein [Isosphaeraceae bacterium]|jgi:pSer/pThr/pTyr-binding forkhead associated (FHA) protein
MWARLIHNPASSAPAPLINHDSAPGNDPATAPEPAAVRVRLLLRDEWLNELALAVDGPRFIIGRARHCDLRSRSAMVSRLHATIERRDGRVFVRDLETKNGTVLGGRILHTAEAEAFDGDRIQIGPVTLTLEVTKADDAADPSTRSVHPPR